MHVFENDLPGKVLSPFLYFNTSKFLYFLLFSCKNKEYIFKTTVLSNKPYKWWF